MIVAPSTTAPAPTAARAASSRPPVVATSEGPTPDGAAPSRTAIAGVMPAGTAQSDGPRNAPPGIEPTPEQWAHLFAVRARLSPREVAIVETVILRMAPETRAQWLAELSVLSVDEAAEIVRSMIPKAPPLPPFARNGGKDHGKDGGAVR
jgi:hypothetical protein